MEQDRDDIQTTSNGVYVSARLRGDSETDSERCDMPQQILQKRMLGFRFIFLLYHDWCSESTNHIIILHIRTRSTAAMVILAARSRSRAIGAAAAKAKAVTKQKIPQIESPTDVVEQKRSSSETHSAINQYRKTVAQSSSNDNTSARENPLHSRSRSRSKSKSRSRSKSSTQSRTSLSTDAASKEYDRKEAVSML